jgi:hypothetical protein
MAKQQIPLEEQLQGMSKTALARMLEEQYGMAVEDRVTKQKMVEHILKLHMEELKKSHRTTKSATKVFTEAGEKTVSVLFQHLDGDKELKFAYSGTKGILVNKRTGKPRPIQTFHLIHGQVYDLPLSVVDHLNSRVVPDVITVPGPDGQITTRPITRKRFSCEIQLTPEQREALMSA